MIYRWILWRYVVDVACDTWSDTRFENGYETRALKLLCGMWLVIDGYGLMQALKMVTKAVVKFNTWYVTWD